MRYRQVLGLAWLLGALLGTAQGTLRADEPALAPPVAKPPWQRLLQGEDARKAKEQEARLFPLQMAGKFEEALELVQACLKRREKAQGADHWETVNLRWTLDALRRVLRQEKEARDSYARCCRALRQGDALRQASRLKEAQSLYEEALAIRRKVLGEEHPRTADTYNNVAANLLLQGRLKEAEEGLRKALALRRKLLGDEHPHTADSCHNLAHNLELQGKHAAAEEHYRKALASYRKVYGEKHSQTAQTCNRLALNLHTQGKYAAAQPLLEKTLALRRKLLGEEHPLTAASCDLLAFNLLMLGRNAEAVEATRKALALHRKLYSEEHPRTVNSYHNLVGALSALGRYAEAEKDARKVLALRRKLFGDDHPATAQSSHNLAYVLKGQGKYKEAEQEFRKALAVFRKVLGDKHPDTARGYHNLAATLHALGRHAEAEAGFRKALASRRALAGEERPETAESYYELALALHAQEKYTEAEQANRQALAIRRKVLGEEHADTARSHHNLALTLTARGRYADAEEGYRKARAIFLKLLGEEHADTANSYGNLAVNLWKQGRYAEAEADARKALAIRRKVHGEEHPTTAGSYSNLALILKEQGKYAEAEANFRKALAAYRRTLGDEHLDMATSYSNLASILSARGRYAEAEEGVRKTLTILHKVRGEEHPRTANAYRNLALNLRHQGRYAEAEEVLHKVLVIRRKVLGEEHRDTATSYDDLANNLWSQARYAAAEAASRKSLDICRKVLGEEHSETAGSYTNLALDLSEQGRYAEAEQHFRKALAIYRKALREENVATAIIYNNLAYNLNKQGRYKEADEGFRKALDIFRKVLGEEHPDTAARYDGLAHNLAAQGRYKEAEEYSRKALAIRRTVLGEDHPHTISSYTLLGAILNARGKYAVAETLWVRAADSFAKSRLRITASGLDRATKTSKASPLPFLVAVLARNGKPEAAWQRFEESLAPGTRDELFARLRRPAAEQARQTELVNRLHCLDQLIERTLSPGQATQEQKKRRAELLTQRRQVQEELDAFARHLEKTSDPGAGRILGRKQIQASLPADTALVGWLDFEEDPKEADPNGAHWAVLLRAAGPPVWVRLAGTGPGGAWRSADTRLTATLRDALRSPRGAWQPLARRLRQQRLGPLAKHLAAGDGLPAVRRLIVLPSDALGGVPVEVLAAGYTVSYALSGTLYAHFRKQPKPATKGLLALADPVFDRPALTDKDPPLPKGGVLLTVVPPGSNAARAGLRPGDVLLRYHDTDLAGPANFRVVPESDDPARRVSLTVWRNGKTFTRPVRPGKLGVVLASDPAPQALRQQRRLDRRLTAAARGGDDKWEQLPGTRVEVEALRRLFGGEPRLKLLCDEQASEQQLDQLARSGELARYRYIHLATHGIEEDRFPLRSAVILARDNLPDPARQLEAGLPVYDGRLTAEEVLRRWRLHSELVTLSACQTALGKSERGEGFVGFTQALLVAGSRSVCLSLWKVDDTATALLMERFYQNLLGKRQGLAGPLPKAQALAEAKAWLRGLSREEVLKRAAQLSQGVARGKGRKALPPLPAPPKAAGGAKEERPYSHPYYWAAFILLGDPD